MLKMSEKSKAFIQKNIPSALGMEKLGDVLNALFELIEDKGYAPPNYYDYNDFGREAQKVYDDVFLSNTD